MIKRKIQNHIELFLRTHKNQALLVTGARQVGKTYIIRKVGKKFDNFAEFNLLEDQQINNLISESKNSDDFLIRLSAISKTRLVPGKTLVFFDEVQVNPQLITAIKFLVEDGRYQYILSGSLLGVELHNIKSMPVGYMSIYEMFPVDFEEFVFANGFDEKIYENLWNTFVHKKPVDSFVHSKLMEIFRLYLIVGGMPAVVEKYLQTHNMKDVALMQHQILEMFKADISKYDPKNKLYLNEIIEIIPSQLNASNKRFILKNLNENFKFSRYSNSFLWLKNSKVAIPVYCTSEPVYPLLLTKSANLFKLFLCDVGLLTSMYPGIQFKILSDDPQINFGSVYENYAAQELLVHGVNLYFYNNKKFGEVDFLVEKDSKIIPIEIKSGKKYKKHSALKNLLSNKKYDITEAHVFHNGNVEVEDKVTYFPVYMISFLKNFEFTDDFIYEVKL